jgi:hypothetical protein
VCKTGGNILQHPACCAAGTTRHRRVLGWASQVSRHGKGNWAGDTVNTLHHKQSFLKPKSVDARILDLLRGLKDAE